MESNEFDATNNVDSDLNFWQDIPDDVLLELQDGLTGGTSFPSTDHTFDDFAFGASFLRNSTELSSSHNMGIPSVNDKFILQQSNNNTLVLSQTIVREISEAGAQASGINNVKIKQEQPSPPSLPTPITVATTTTTNTVTTLYSDIKPNVLELNQLRGQFELLLKDVTEKQRNITVNQMNEYHSLQKSLFKFQQDVTKCVRETIDLMKTHIIKPPELYDLQLLKQLFTLQHQKSELLITELKHLASDDDKCVAAIAITEQPLSQVVFKGRALDGHFTVDVVTGARTLLDKASLVQASLTEDETFKSAKPIENDKAELAPSKHSATFEEIKVNVSTRMTPVTLKFSCHVKERGKEDVVKISSLPTNPIIVITNESQWGEAAGKLLQAEAFGPTLGEIPWALLINTVQIHLFNATQQELKVPSRQLADWEILWIQTKFFGNRNKITKEQYTTFWSWFGQVLTTIRFKRHVRALWFHGIVYGLIDKKACVRVLNTEDIGTFIIRFSDSTPGSFAVAYVTDDPKERVKHYLIKPEDVGSNKSLPDFLKDRSQFRTVVRLDPATGVLSKCNKELLFASYYSKRKVVPTDKSGYVQHVQ